MDFLSLFLVVLVLVIAYLQMLYGLFSAVIMCVLVVLCSALALATYEWLALTHLVGPLGDLAPAAALVGTFVIPLIVLRVVLDTVITRSSMLPVLIDRVCAAGVGLLSGMIMTGMLALGIQMLPLGGSFLGHKWIDRETGEETSLWLGPDRFAVGFVSMLSDGLFSGRQSFSFAHPDLVQEMQWANASPNEILHVVPAGAIEVVGLYPADYIFDKSRPDTGRRRNPDEPADYKRVNPNPGRKWYLVRVKLKTEARDENQRLRFARRQVRLVGREAPGDPLKNFAPVAINDDERVELAVRIADDKLYTPHEGSVVDFVFDVSERFEAEFIEYMMGARADLAHRRVEAHFLPIGGQPAAPGPAATTSAPAPSEPEERRSGDRVSGVRTTRESHFGDDLPMTLTDYQQFDLEHRQEALVSGQLYGNVDEQGSGGSEARLSKFAVPSDKRLFHLEVEQLRARSLFGRALSQAITTAQNYRLSDTTGNEYLVVGQYAIAMVDGREVVEIHYFPEMVTAGNRGGIRDFRRVTANALDVPGSRLVYLFLVNPGARLTRFTTGRSPADLTDLNLVAPE